MNELLVLETSEIIVTKAELNFDDTEFREVAEKIAETIRNQEFDESKMKVQKKYIANVRKMSRMVADKRKEITEIASGNIATEIEKMKQVEKLLKDSADEFDKSFKAYEEIQKDNKKTEISNEFNKKNTHQFISFYDFFEPTMLNKGTTMKSIIEKMDYFLAKIDNDLNIINGFDADGKTLQYYIQHKDLAKAMEQKKIADENKRIAEEMKLKREEQQKLQEEQNNDELDEKDREEEFEFVDIFEEEQEEVNNNAMKLKEEIESKEKKLRAIQDEIDRLENIKREFYTEIEELKQELNRKLGI